MGTFVTVIGGIGLFLLGMSLMTDGLKAIAGNALKQLLSKFTGGVFSSILSGTVITAIIQSSSATTFLTIGFVSAGLLTFGQSIGVIIGANLGSTSTGWIVSVLGFKVNMGVLAFPIVGIGALLKMFSRDRLAPYGIALAGFGLLFLGIDVLQQGMSGIDFNLGAYAGDTFFNKIFLIFLGMVMTVIMQSSSAAMVITITALYTNTLTFDQAALLVIGQNVGTTFKALIASIGGTTPAKQTAAAHIVFNLITGFIAFILLPILIPFVFKLSSWMNIDDLSTTLAIFHTVFVLVGVIIVIAILPLFKTLIARIVPDKGEELTKYLDPTVAELPPVAIESVRRTLVKVTRKIAKLSQPLFLEKKANSHFLNDLTQVENALAEVRAFLGKVGQQTNHLSRSDYKNHLAMIHAIDHLNRLIKALKEYELIEFIDYDENVKELSDRLINLFNRIETDLKNEQFQELAEQAEENSQIIAENRRKDRERILKNSAKIQLDIDTAIETVHTIHWIDGLAFHLWRAIHYLNVYEKAVEEVNE